MANMALADRNGKHFGAILNYLRDGTIPLPETRRETMELQVSGRLLHGQDMVCRPRPSITAWTSSYWAPSRTSARWGSR